MSMTTKMQDLVTRVATEFRTIKTMISGSPTGDASGLQTSVKNLVGALNEVRAVALSKAAINDSMISPIEVWSSQKTSAEITTAINNLVAGAPEALDTLNELSNALAGDGNFAANLTNTLSNIQAQISANDADIVNLQSQITSNDADIVDLQSQISANDGDISALQAATATNAAGVAANLAEIDQFRLTNFVAQFNGDLAQAGDGGGIVNDPPLVAAPPPA